MKILMIALVVFWVAGAQADPILQCTVTNVEGHFRQVTKAQPVDGLTLLIDAGKMKIDELKFATKGGIIESALTPNQAFVLDEAENGLVYVAVSYETRLRLQILSEDGILNVGTITESSWQPDGTPYAQMHLFCHRSNQPLRTF